MANADPDLRKPDASLEDVTRCLELDVVLGRLRPRERLVEDDLIARFQAKRHVIRSALAELERLGLAVRRPNRGVAIREYSAEEVREIYDFRAELHRLAIERMPLPLPDEALTELSLLHAAHRAAVLAGNLAEVIVQNNRFHDALFDRCGNRYIAESIRLHGWMSHAIRSYRIADPDLLEQAMTEHLSMIDFARIGDRDALSELCVRHIEPSRRKYFDDLSRYGTGRL